MKQLHFVTPTRVDIRELCTLGLGSKRGDDTKIGHKGSGMKFAIALIHRLGSSLTVVVEGKTWRSKLSTIEVRGVEHQTIQLAADDGEVREMNIVLQAGADTWTTSWYALRELLQNCIDEQGFFSESGGDALPDVATHTGTIMSLDMTDQLLDAWDNRGHWYHRRQRTIYDRGAHAGGLFYHGFRISTEDKWNYCYDATELIGRENLSEDRQAKGIRLSDLFGKMIRHPGTVITRDHYAKMASHTGRDDDISLILDAAYMGISSEVHVYGCFNFTHLEDEFINIHGERVTFCNNRNPTSREEYYAKGAGVKIVMVHHRLGYLLQYSKRIRDIAEHIPTLSARLKAVRAADLDQSVKRRLKIAERLTRSMRPLGCKVDIVDVEFKDDNDGMVCAKADIEANRVMLMRRWAESASTAEIVEGLIEEYAHINSRAGDGSIDFEKHLIRIIAAKVMPRPKALGTEAEFAL